MQAELAVELADFLCQLVAAGAVGFKVTAKGVVNVIWNIYSFL